jgi:hypothetical protein
MKDHIKVFFTIPSSDSEETETESLWATQCDDGYKLDNIPFYAKGVALNDVVSAEETNGYLCVTSLLKPSGHSTVRIWFANTDDIEPFREILRKIGCASEISDVPRLIAVDIPPDVDYSKIRRILDEGLSEEKWDYQEACLGFL